MDGRARIRATKAKCEERGAIGLLRLLASWLTLLWCMTSALHWSCTWCLADLRLLVCMICIKRDANQCCCLLACSFWWLLSYFILDTSHYMRGLFSLACFSLWLGLSAFHSRLNLPTSSWIFPPPYSPTLVQSDKCWSPGMVGSPVEPHRSMNL